jgi:predicted TPR repeat methyltransferase
VLDIGCGRGELLSLLRDNGIESRGIDIDQAMVNRCLAQGLPVEHANLFTYLESVEPRSLGGIVATQVIEHLTHQELRQMLTLIQRSLKKDGVVLLETINPQSVSALSRNFFRDPTHVFPVHPDTLRFTLEMLGFNTADVLYRSPYPDSAKLQEIPYEAELPARWIGVLQRMNDNVSRLNDLLYGPQDYALIARNAT